MKRTSNGTNVKEVLASGFWEGGVCVMGELESEITGLEGIGGCVLFQTSGTTGAGTWVVLGKEGLLVSARAVNEWLGVDDESVWGLALPLNHVGGFGVVARAFAAGCGVATFEGKWDAGRFAEWVKEEGVTHVSLVPTQVHDLVAGGLEGGGSLVAVVVGGGRISEELGDAARKLGWPLLASYGMTEAGSQVATQELARVGEDFGDCPLKVLPVWEVEVSAEGLFRLRGEALFLGTLVEEGGQMVFRRREDDWFDTRDRGNVYGDEISVEGRADAVVKILGELVNVEGVERKFLEMAGGRIVEGSFTVVAVADERRGNLLVAVAEEGAGNVDEVYEEFQEKVGGLERLAGLVRVAEFPRTGLGKIRRGVLGETCAKELG
ncbi:MAG: AMP-binding protein [Luteolibacter sp.]